jgi:hypothetical protein
VTVKTYSSWFPKTPGISHAGVFAVAAVADIGQGLPADGCLLNL